MEDIFRGNIIVFGVDAIHMDFSLLKLVKNKRRINQKIFKNFIQLFFGEE